MWYISGPRQVRVGLGELIVGAAVPGMVPGISLLKAVKLHGSSHSIVVYRDSSDDTFG